MRRESVAQRSIAPRAVGSAASRGTASAAATVVAVPSAAADVEMAVVPGTTTVTDEIDKMDVGEDEERETK